ncbi:hypothetical protein L1787_00085 [Acuticoccus sp. M5D2P5]|uniref:hypothetical protein n=1 Tax=Acuticoccus kalidii TaxID=2910977 RepID=UPI001F2523D6|nr:hypothetical protein [Acuticoccus kalidii]MCF3931811.1 hypothetical protein [Acuticoccus kalidii]
MGAAAKAAESFLSERCDEAVTLMDPKARYYDPRITRFIQSDLLDPMSEASVSIGMPMR